MEERDEIRRAVEVLRNGGVILYPTDTVWGLGCDATNPEAVARIFRLKHRPDSKSLVLLASDMDMVCRYVNEIPEIAVQLVEVNDKPMTIVYPGARVAGAGERADRFLLAANTVAEDGSVAVRVPLDGFCRRLVAAFGRPVVSTSANVSGEATPRDYREISEAVKSAVDCIVDPSFGKGATGKSSSIIKVDMDSSVVIIRK
ncbi:MAG: L-threonylcarbamoyladenylate synthase [Candidatus Cryptobacteroides sp.]